MPLNLIGDLHAVATNPLCFQLLAFSLSMRGIYGEVYEFSSKWNEMVVMEARANEQGYDDDDIGNF